MKTAAAYIRVSTDDQTEFSPASQLSHIREYAKRNDYLLPEEFIFVDEGISGRKAEKRPQFMKMIGLAKSSPKPFDSILLWKFSRFARNREDSIVYKSMLRKQYGIDVISISENLGDDKMSVLIEALIEAMDEFYSINLSEEVKRGMTEKAKRGGVLSVPAYGYSIENGRFVPVPEEACVIRSVFERYTSGVGMLRIAKELNALGIRTHRGGKIENRTVEYWLNNPVYIGKIRWTPTGKIRRNYHNADSIIADGEHEPIIDADLWNAAQSIMRKQKERYGKWYKPAENKSHWLVGLVRCGICGGAMVSAKKQYLYCNNKYKGTCPGNGAAKISKLEAVILAELKAIINSDVVIDVPTEKRSAGNTDNTDRLIEGQIKKACLKLERIREAYRLGIDSIEEYTANKKIINSEISVLTSQLSKKTTTDTKDDEDFRTLRRKILSVTDELEKSEDTQLKNELARTFISEIIKTDNTFNIFYFV